MREDNIHTASLGGWEEVVTVYGDGEVTQERMIDADGANVTAKKKAKQSSNVDENKVDKKRRW